MDLNTIDWQALSKVLPKNNNHLVVETPQANPTGSSHLRLTLNRQQLILEKWSPVKKWHFIYDLAKQSLQNKSDVSDSDALDISNQIISTLLNLNEHGKAKYSVR